MEHTDTPFDWVQVRSYVRGAKFSYHRRKFRPVIAIDNECIMAIPSLSDMVDIRSWLNSHIQNPYQKFGLFALTLDDERNFELDCLGVRFAFETPLDLSFFQMSCHSGRIIEIG